MTHYVELPPNGGGLGLITFGLVLLAAAALLETLFGWAADLWDSIATYALHLWHLIA